MWPRPAALCCLLVPRSCGFVQSCREEEIYLTEALISHNASSYSNKQGYTYTHTLMINSKCLASTSPENSLPASSQCNSYANCGVKFVGNRNTFLMTQSKTLLEDWKSGLQTTMSVEWWSFEMWRIHGTLRTLQQRCKTFTCSCSFSGLTAHYNHEFIIKFSYWYPSFNTFKF